MSDHNTTRNSFCTFRVGKLQLGVEVGTVQEVIRSQPTTPVPLADQEVKGLMNLRGQIVTAIDLQTRLGLPIDESDLPLMNVVVRSDDGPISLLVNEIGDVVQCDQTRFERPPKTLQGKHRQFIRGALKLDNGLLLLLDTSKVIQTEAA